jgi:hypothetical protein
MMVSIWFVPYENLEETMDFTWKMKVSCGFSFQFLEWRVWIAYPIEADICMSFAGCDR